MEVKPEMPDDDHIVVPLAQWITRRPPALVPAADDPDVFIFRIKYQVPRLGLVPGDGVAVGVLGMGSSAMADHIFPGGYIVKYPVHISRAIQAVGPVGAGGGTARGL